ncbi:MAG: VOC family protein [Candidatus Eremiobacteraeota bacterium]|nr:VOC family protein [Candidatus Eremiobacteraeota bacterium]
MKKITPFLWFDGRAEEAAILYTSIFRNSAIQNISRYGEGENGEPGAVMTVAFQLDGEEFIALNGGPAFEFSPAVSFLVRCESQQEVDHFWNELSNGGEQQQCGWLRDRFGVTWQIVPTILGDLLQDDDDEKATRVMQAMLKMHKLDIGELQRAYDGR